MSKEYIKEVIKGMIESGEITIKYESFCSKESYDGFGNAAGAITDIDLQIYLEVNDD